MTTEIVYTWPNGSQDVLYRRPKDSPESIALVKEVSDLQARHGKDCPYSFRHVRFTAPEIAYMQSDSFQDDR